jgi:hypothetical protein
VEEGASIAKELNEVESQPIEKKKLFLSYGRSDATEVAQRLRRNLSDRFDGWIDSQEIDAGAAWEPAIQFGLRECDAVVVLLSPHAVCISGRGSGAVWKRTTKER